MIIRNGDIVETRTYGELLVTDVAENDTLIIVSFDLDYDGSDEHTELFAIDRTLEVIAINGEPV